jgi:GGDEF domain-containing protein
MRDADEVAMSVIAFAHPAPEPPLTGPFNRTKLLADLEAALVPGTGPSVLAVFELVGIKPLLAAVVAEEVESLLTRLALRLMRELGPAAECYRPRREEFCALLPMTDAAAALGRATAGLIEAAKPLPIGVLYATTLLPEEAATPLEALERADKRLFALAHPEDGRRRRDR